MHVHTIFTGRSPHLLPTRENDCSYWLRQCLLDAYHEPECPACGEAIYLHNDAGATKVLCRLHNEGGVQENLGIFPFLQEEAHLKIHPEQRRARAFLQFRRDFDLEGVLSVLQDVLEDDEQKAGFEDEGERMSTLNILRYQDPLGDFQSPLHAAVTSGNQDLAWLVLYVGSTLPNDNFPSDLFQQAHTIGLERVCNEADADVRNSQDGQSRMAAQLAAETGGVWSDWVQSGRLRSNQ